MKNQKYKDAMLNEDGNYANQEQSLEIDKGMGKWLSASCCHCIELHSLFLKHYFI
jgi:hypothetical protein